MYRFMPGGYKAKNLRASKYKSILNAGYFHVLTEFILLRIWIYKQSNEMRIESANYSVSNPYVYLLSMCIHMYIARYVFIIWNH